MEKLVSILPKVLQKRNLSSEARASRMIYVAKVFLANRYSKNICEKIHSYKFHEGILYIGVTHSVYAQEMRLVTLELMDFIHTQLPETHLTDIRVKHREERGKDCF